MIKKIFVSFQGTQRGAESDFNFFQDNHDPMTNVTDSTMDSSDA